MNFSLLHFEYLPVDWDPTTAIMGRLIYKLTSDFRIMCWISEIRGINLSMFFDVYINM